MRTPIRWYGGKQNMINDILPLIPPHTTYCEPFCGGAAIFFAKQKAQINILNDKNRELINFYTVLKTPESLEKLNRLLNCTLYGKNTYNDALVIYNHPHLFSKIKRAWAMLVLSKMSFVSTLRTYGRNTKAKHGGNNELMAANCLSWKNTKERLAKTDAIDLFSTDANMVYTICRLMENVQLENDDALKIIARSDTDNTFFYIDPPYIDTNQGHYKGYDANDFEKLLTLVANIKGKALISTYDNDLIRSYSDKYNWKIMEVEKMRCAGQQKERTFKNELLITTYLQNE